LGLLESRWDRVHHVLLQVIITQQGKLWLIYTVVKRNLCIITGNFRNNTIIRIVHVNDDDDDDVDNNNNKKVKSKANRPWRPIGL
jgi:hypothetical protein